MNNKSKQSGTILFIALLFILLLSLLALSAFESSLLNHKMNQPLSSNLQNFVNAEQALKHIEKRVSEHDVNECFIDKGLTPYQSSIWWTQQRCHISIMDSHIVFVVEQLDSDPCAQMLSKRGAVIYRITLRSQRAAFGRSLILQSTFAIPLQKQEACHQNPYPLSYGRLSWRELD